ncbi:MAG: putative glycoside hydrolase [Eubacteriales bacterium]|nr:putative glycoside hydrolase [Eubacteriales bacterium]
MVIKKIKHLFFITIIIFSLPFIFSCTSFEPVEYNVYIAESESEEKIDFSFKSKNINEEEKVLTKKNKDRLANEKIKALVSNSKREAIKVKGLYYPAYILGDQSKFNDIMNKIINSNINTIVVDIKDDNGQITAEINSELLKSYNTFSIQLKNIEEMMKILKEHNIYMIARVASFRDTFLARKRNDLAIMTKFGFLYRDDTKYAWLNPYKKEVWDYLVEIGKGCKRLGFDEVQFDYFRFSTDRGMMSVFFDDKETDGRSKNDILIECSQYIYEKLLQEGLFVSIDVFGSIINSYKDQDSVGQNYSELLKYCDYISPMVYPSHYGAGYFGLTLPDKEPYNCVLSALNSSKTLVQSNYDITSHYGTVRPWLQGFTADYMSEYMNYGVNEYLEQIKAVYDSGYEEWIFWNAGGNYAWEAFKKEDITNET